MVVVEFGLEMNEAKARSERVASCQKRCPKQQAQSNENGRKRRAPLVTPEELRASRAAPALAWRNAKAERHVQEGFKTKGQEETGSELRNEECFWDTN